MCPVSVLRHRPLNTSHTLSVRSNDPDTTLPFGRAATHQTCAPDCSDALFAWTPAPCPVRVPGQRLETLTARHVPHHERVVVRPGHDVAVRQGGDALDLRPSRRRRAIDALFDRTPAPRVKRVPGQRPEALAARHVPDLERGVVRPGHDAAVRQDDDAIDLRPSLRRRAIDARFDWTPAPHIARVPAQRLEALAAQRVPDLERAVARPRNDAVIRQDGDALDLRPSRSTSNRRFCSTGRRRRASLVCPVSVWRHSPLDTSHTMSVLS